VLDQSPVHWQKVLDAACAQPPIERVIRNSRRQEIDE